MLTHPARVGQVMSRWLPMATALFSMVATHLPSPVEAQRYRLPVFWTAPDPAEDVGESSEPLVRAMDTCQAPAAVEAPPSPEPEAEPEAGPAAASEAGPEPAGAAVPTVVYICKMFAVNSKDMPGAARSRAVGTQVARAVPPRRRQADAGAKQPSSPAAATSPSPSPPAAAAAAEPSVREGDIQRSPSTNPVFALRESAPEVLDENFIGFGRVFCGELRVGQLLHVIDQAGAAEDDELGGAEVS